MNGINIGLLGGVGSGKSTFSQLFVELGAETLDVKCLLQRVTGAPEIQNQIRHILGDQTMGESQFTPFEMAAHVMQDPAGLKLSQLEASMRPAMKCQVAEMLGELAANGAQHRLLDVPRLWEMGLHDTCNFLIYIDSHFDVRNRRLQKNRGWDETEIREAEQFVGHLDEKRKIADFIVRNDGEYQELRQQAHEIWNSLP